MERAYSSLMQQVKDVAKAPFAIAARYEDDREIVVSSRGFDGPLPQPFRSRELFVEADLFESPDLASHAPGQEFGAFVARGISSLVAACARAIDGEPSGAILLLANRPLILDEMQKIALRALAAQLGALGALEVSENRYRELERRSFEVVSGEGKMEPGGLPVCDSDVVASQAAVARSEERFRLVANVTTDAIYDWNIEDGDVWWNTGFESLTGYRRDDFADFEARERLIHPSDAEAVTRSLKVALDSDVPRWVDFYRIVDFEGRTRNVLDQGYLIRNESGEAIRMIGGMSDETQRIAVERKLREQAALLDQAQDAIFVCDLDARVTFWNRGAERVYGLERHEAIGRSLAQFAGDHGDTLLDAIREVEAIGSWSGDLYQRRSDGTLIIVESRMSLLIGDDRRDLAILAINTDVTAQRELEDRILRAQRVETLGQLAGGIAHDINNVLAPILITTSLLLDSAEDEELAEDLRNIQTAAQRGSEMVRRILAFTKGTAGERRPIDVCEAARDAIQIVRETFPKSIEFELELGERCWAVTSEPVQIHQIVTNLLVNSRDAMGAGGRIRVSATNAQIDRSLAAQLRGARPGNYVRIEVSDTGTGIDPELEEKIFELYFTTKSEDGTGIGLSTVSAIVDRHGGFITIDSELGVGTRVSVFLPADCDEHEVGDSERRRTIRPDTVLLADQECALIRATRRALEHYGYRVVAASSGPDALATLEADPEIGLVLVDLGMAGAGGGSIVDELRAARPDLLIVASSSGEVAPSSEAVSLVGADRILPKPYTARRLICVLDEVLVERSPHSFRTWLRKQLEA